MGTKDDGIDFEFDRAMRRAMRDDARAARQRKARQLRARQLVKLCTRIVRVALDRTFTEAQ